MKTHNCIKRVGVNKGSYQFGLLRDWKEKNGLSFEITELTVDETESMNSPVL